MGLELLWVVARCDGTNKKPPVIGGFLTSLPSSGDCSAQLCLIPHAVRNIVRLKFLLSVAK